jgi:hypothetical protein
LKKTSFFFGAAVCKLVRDDASWETAEETINILQAGWNVLAEKGGTIAGVCHTNIALHLQLKNKPVIELLKPFAAIPFTQTNTEPITAVAAIVRWKDRRLTIDGSGSLANGIFVRLERDFPGSLSFYDIARELRSDEERVFDLIGVKEDL